MPTSSNDVTLSHVTYAELQAELSFSLADHGILGEEQGLGSMLRPGHLCKHNSHHKGLRHDPKDRLHAHHENGFRTLFCSRPNTITNRVLSLDGEEEA